jgi:hypothetical protein
MRRLMMNLPRGCLVYVLSFYVQAWRGATDQPTSARLMALAALVLMGYALFSGRFEL